MLGRDLPTTAYRDSQSTLLEQEKLLSCLGWSSPQGALSLPPPLRVVKTGKNHLNEEITPLLPTGIGERIAKPHQI
jgi:hypothetical protein